MGEPSIVAPIETGGEPAGVVDAHARVLIVDIEKRMGRLEKALKSVTNIQRKNLPLFTNTLQEVTAIRETLHSHAEGLSRVEKMAADSGTVTAALAESVRAITATQEAMANTQKANGEKLDNLVDLLSHAKTWGGYLKKYGAKALPFIIGLMVARGWITIDTGKSFTQIFTG